MHCYSRTHSTRHSRSRFRFKSPTSFRGCLLPAGAPEKASDGTKTRRKRTRKRHLLPLTSSMAPSFAAFWRVAGLSYMQVRTHVHTRTHALSRTHSQHTLRSVYWPCQCFSEACAQAAPASGGPRRASQLHVQPDYVRVWHAECESSGPIRSALVCSCVGSRPLPWFRCACVLCAPRRLTRLLR